MNTKKMRIFPIACRVILVAMLVVWIFPVLFALNTSFKDQAEFYSNIWALPKKLGLDNYIQAFSQGHIGEYFLNSIIIAVVSVKFPTKSENNLKYALQTVKNHPSRLLFSQNILNLFQNKSKVFQAS